MTPIPSPIVRRRPRPAPVLLIVLLALVLAGPLPGAGAAGAVPDWKEARLVKVVGDLDGPANIALAPDGTIWYAEAYKGDVSKFDPSTGTKTLVHHFNAVSAGDERGLTGLALHPDFAKNGVYYAYYAEPDPENASGGTNKLVMMDGDHETILASLTAFEEHNSGRILVVDRTLFVSTGENQKRWPAQDPRSLLGKILHMTLEGQPVPGNVGGIVYDLGHRNPYGLAYNPSTKELWETENSGWRRDEVNIIQAKSNYGYPECEGRGLNGVSTPCPTDKGYVFPIMSFYEDHTAAPTGCVFWRGEFYWLALKEGSVHHLWKGADGQYHDEVVFDTDELALDLRVSPDDGSLYFASWDAIWRIEFPSLGPAPPPADRAATGAAVSSVELAWAIGGLCAVALAARRGR